MNLRKLVTRNTPRHKILFESAIFDTLLGINLLIGAWFIGEYSTSVTRVVDSVLGAPTVWGLAFLGAGIMSMVGLRINSWAERFALGAIAAINAARSIGFLLISVILITEVDTPVVFTLGFATSIVFARVAFSAFHHAADVRYSEPLNVSEQ